MNSFRFSRGRSSQQAVALIIVLAFVVLLTGLVVAFFSNSVLYRQISNSSASAIKVDLFAGGAVDTIVGDLKQEIVAGSVTSTPASGVSLYMPKVPLDMVPSLVGTNVTLANLLKRSAYNDPNNATSTSVPLPFYANPTPASSAAGYVPPYDVAQFPPSARAAHVSTVTPSLNGRYISPSRWNKPLLLPKDSSVIASDTDLTPDKSAFVAPDWILTARDGTNPTDAYNSNMAASTSGQKSVIGRYAYAMYDEGGLLDTNVAGYPTDANGRGDLPGTTCKNALAFADLTQLPGVKDLAPGRQLAVINSVVGWRNFASAQATDSGSLSGGFTFTIPMLTSFTSAMLGNSNGFLKTSNTTLVAGQTDRMFSSRQEMMKLVLNGIAQGSAERTYLQKAMQYLGTFSRDLNQPSYVPAPHTDATAPVVLHPILGGTAAYRFDKEINPNYLTVRVQKSFTRKDGSTAAAGDPLVSKRFPLQRLAWLTYKGPSLGRPQSDPDIKALTDAGIPYSYLQLCDSYTIEKYFGLTWDGSKWTYVHNGAGSGKGPIMRVGRNPALDPVADPTRYVQDLSGADAREPDFFELLKSAISIGSLGKSLAANPSLTSACTTVSMDNGASNAGEQPYNYNYDPEVSVDRQVIQIGANILNQFRADNYPVQIVFDDAVGNRNGTGTSPTTVVGVANLPYLYHVMSGTVQVKAPAPLPRAGRSDAVTYSRALGTGVGGDAGYLTTDTISDPGIGAIMQMPAVWNPHDPASPAAVAGPTQFRVVADSTTPDQATGGGASYNKFFAYSSSIGTPQGSYSSYDAITTSPGSTWYRSGSGTGAEIAHAITADNSAVYFTASSGMRMIFPEPTLLMRAGSITDSLGNAVNVFINSSNSMATDAALGGAGAGGLTNYLPVPINSALPYPNTTHYVGFYMAPFPYAWTNALPKAPSSGAQSAALLARVTSSTTRGGSAHACYMTYRMQYQDPNNGAWVTYDTKYGKVADDIVPVINNSLDPAAGMGVLFSEGGSWASVADPRTSRFGIQWNGTIGVSQYVGTNGAVVSDYTGGLPASVLFAGWLDAPNGILKTNRPDAQSGFYFMANWNRTGGGSGDDNRRGGMPKASSGWMAWASSDGYAFPGLAPGLLAQNNTDIPYSPSRSYGDPKGRGTHTPNYFADPDGIVRRAMGAFVPTGTVSSPTNPSGDTRLPSGDTTVGIPTCRVFGSPPTTSPTINVYSTGSTLSQAQSRPYFLHRPFRSVAELGCVFSDTPWRNLDFFTSESGDGALLDVFCVNETSDPTGLVAGKVNLNARQVPVLQAIIGGSYLDPANASGNNSVTKPMDSATAANLVSAFTTYIKNNGPLKNVAELVSRWKAPVTITMPPGLATSQPPLNPPFYDGKLSYTGFSGGDWDINNHKPRITSPAADVYSAYMSSSSFATTTNHNGTQETAAYVQRFREAPIRALSATGQTRVWNLMIDLVAQTGRYPTNATGLANFIVEGEQRYWVHLAIDRYSGQVIDKQVELVKE